MGTQTLQAAIPCPLEFLRYIHECPKQYRSSTEVRADGWHWWQATPTRHWVGKFELAETDPPPRAKWVMLDGRILDEPPLEEGFPAI